MSTNTNITYKDFNNICRTCMITSDLKPLNQHNVIVQVLHNLTDISFETNDELPQQICTKCYEKIIEINAFALQCKQTHLCLTKSLDEFKIGIQIKEEILDIEENELELVKKETPDFEEVFVPNPSCVKFEIEETTDNDTPPNTMFSQLPPKSKMKYQNAYDRYIKWCIGKKVKNETNEKALLAYFEYLSKTYKSSSLWAYYSMLRSTISMKKKVEISGYKQLIEFLKSQSKGYKPKKSKTFTKEDVEKYLKEADDEKCLLNKVVLIIGIAGACRKDELTNLLYENVKDQGDIFWFQVPTTKSKKGREFFVTSGNINGINMVEIIRKYLNLRLSFTDHGRFFVGYRKGLCNKQPVGINTFGGVPKKIASFLKLPDLDEYTGHSFRRTSASLQIFN